MGSSSAMRAWRRNGKGTAAKAGAKPAAAKPATGAAKAEPGDTGEERFSDSLIGGIAISTAVLGASFGVFYMLYTFMPEKGVSMPLVAAVVQCFGVVFSAVGLII